MSAKDTFRGTPRTSGGDAEWLQPVAGHRYIGYVESCFASRSGKNYVELRQVVTLHGTRTVSIAQKMLANRMSVPVASTDIGSIAVVTVSATKTRQGRDGREYPLIRCEVIERGGEGWGAARNELARLLGGASTESGDGDDDAEVWP